LGIILRHLLRQPHSSCQMYFASPSACGQRNQYAQYGQCEQFGGQYGQLGQYGAMNSGQKDYLQGFSKTIPRRRLNIVSICLTLFVPWLTFSLLFAMLTFSMHYRSASLCRTIAIIAGVVYALMALYAILSLIRRWTSEEAAAREAPSWLLFLSITSLVALVLAVALGNRNFWTNMQPYYDITALNSYQGVDPARMRGQELMDAGRVLFVPGTKLDLNRSMSFRNQETYCVAPITGGAVSGDVPLAAYDFFAVGKDCCSGNAADFKCGAYDDPHARGGVRMVRDEDRGFYRLAVQQAQSAYSLKAIHPLFFHWVEDPVAEVKVYRQQAYKWYLTGMFIHFGCQIILVTIAVFAFTQRDWGV